MNRRLLLVLGLLALIAALVFYFLRRDPAGGGKHTTALAGTTGGTAGATAGDRGGSDGRAMPDPRTQRRASIAGTVTVKDGGPLAGATVCSSWSADGATADDTREPVCTRTDAAGGYQLAELVPGNHRLTAFAPQHIPEGWRDRARRRDGLELQPGEARTGIDFALATGGVEISGVVEDVSGGPIADALVWVRADGGWWSSGGRAMTRSDAQGKFTSWTKAGEVSVWASAEGYSDGNTEAVAPSKLVEVLLTPESVLAGIVVEGGSKAPVEGAIVSVGDWRMGEDSSGASARTDAQGTFRLTRLRPGRYKPTAAAQGRYGEPTESVLLGLGQSVEGVVIEVHAAATVRGIVVIDDGSGKTTPCSEGWVNLQDSAAGRWDGDQTDPTGQIEITALLPGHYEVNVACEGYLAKDKYDPIDVTTADVDNLVWTVNSGGRIRGVVKTSDGEPVGRGPRLRRDHRRRRPRPALVGQRPDRKGRHVPPERPGRRRVHARRQRRRRAPPDATQGHRPRRRRGHHRHRHAGQRHHRRHRRRHRGQAGAQRPRPGRQRGLELGRRRRPHRRRRHLLDQGRQAG